LPTGNKCWGAPFKPYFGLSGITALDVPLSPFATRAKGNKKIGSNSWRDWLLTQTPLNPPAPLPYSATY